MNDQSNIFNLVSEDKFIEKLEALIAAVKEKATLKSEVEELMLLIKGSPDLQGLIEKVALNSSAISNEIARSIEEDADIWNTLGEIPEDKTFIELILEASDAATAYTDEAIEQAFNTATNQLNTYKQEQAIINDDIDDRIDDAADMINSIYSVDEIGNQTGILIEEISRSMQADQELRRTITTLIAEDTDKSVRDIASEVAQNITESEVAKIVDAAPETLDTLKEVAEWIAADESGTQAIVNDISNLKNAAEAGAKTDLELSAAINANVQSIINLQAKHLYVHSVFVSYKNTDSTGDGCFQFSTFLINSDSRPYTLTHNNGGSEPKQMNEEDAYDLYRFWKAISQPQLNPGGYPINTKEYPYTANGCMSVEFKTPLSIIQSIKTQLYKFSDDTWRRYLIISGSNMNSANLGTSVMKISCGTPEMNANGEDISNITDPIDLTADLENYTWQDFYIVDTISQIS